MNLLVLITVLNLSQNGVSEPHFIDRTEDSGIDFRHRSGSPDKDWITEVNGSGVALFDFDADGDLDVYLVNAGSDPTASDPTSREKTTPRNALYRNDGPWRFTEIAETAGVDDPGWGSGAIVGDIDSDGDLDLYVTNRGPNVLYLNRGDGTFERSPGVADPGWSISASFADFDRDGLLDIYVANYIDFRHEEAFSRRSGRCQYKGQPIFCGPGGLRPQADTLYLNRGDGRFEDVS